MRNSLSRMIFFVLVILPAISLASCAQDRMPRLCFKDACFFVEVADTDEARTRGLMFRPSLAEGEGMFFVFPESAVYPFWMKNMRFPIDIVWLDENMRVVHALPDVPACKKDPCPTHDPKISAQYVLELPAGSAFKYGFKVGDAAELKQ